MERACRIPPDILRRCGRLFGLSVFHSAGSGTAAPCSASPARKDFRYFSGDTPFSFRKRRLKYMEFSYPMIRAISLTVPSVVSRRTWAFRIRRRRMKRIGDSRADDVSVQRDAVALQDVFYLTAGKVYEPVLGMVGAQEIIMLLLLRLVQDHVSRGNGDVLPVQDDPASAGRNTGRGFSLPLRGLSFSLPERMI